MLRSGFREYEVENCVFLPAAGRRTQFFTSYSRNPESECTIKCTPILHKKLLASNSLDFNNYLKGFALLRTVSASMSFVSCDSFFLLPLFWARACCGGRRPRSDLANRDSSSSSKACEMDKVLVVVYSVVQKNSSMFEFPAFLPPTNLGLPMHSPSALTEHVSLNLARFFCSTL